MIKIIVPFIICLVGQQVFSQSVFTKFIENKSVQWAADISDTFHFVHPNLSLSLRNRVNAGEINVSISEEDKFTGEINYATKDDIINRIAPNREKKIADDDGNLTGTVIESENPLFSVNYFDTQTNDLVEIEQILYLQSGRLKSYTPWFSPKYAVYTSWGQKLGVANAFTTGFNKSLHISSGIQKRAQLLGSTKTMMRLDTNKNMLKQLYEQNLMQALWPHLNKKFYAVYRMDSLIKIQFQNINMSLVDSRKIDVPVYDSAGTITGSQIFTNEDQPLNLSAITGIQLEQNWYYNAKKNIVYSTITALVLFAKKINSDKQDELASPVLKIMLQ